MIILEAKNIYKSYFIPVKQEVLKNIDLIIEEKKIVAISGPSGAGKTTLLNMLASIDKPDSGSIKFLGKDINSFNEVELNSFRANNLGFIFQSYNLLTGLTVLENIILPALIINKSREEARSYAIELLNRLNLANKQSYKPSLLSYGEQQRVAICRALINSPKLILADEPTGNLDINNAIITFSLLYSLVKEKNIALIIVTHNTEIIKQVDNIYKLYDGKLIKLQ